MFSVLKKSGTSSYASFNLKTVAPSMVGTAKKNENSAAAFLFKPCVNPPITVAADLETPGIIAMH